MSPAFDPYREWLGLDATNPPSHYQLLGVAEFEADIGRISAAADARMKQVRSYQTGPRGKYTQKILNELSSAKLCLLDAKAKLNYDSRLRARSEVVATAATPAMMHLLEPPPMAPPMPQPPVLTPWPAPPPPKAALDYGDEAESTAAEPTRAWWLIAAALFGLVMITTIAAGAVIALRQPPAPHPVAIQPDDEKTHSSPLERDRKHRELPADVTISQEATGDLNLPMEVARLGGGLQHEAAGSKSQLIGWQATGAATWKFKLVRPAIFKVQIVYTASPVDNAQWQFEAGHETKAREIHGGNQPEQAVTDEFFWRITKAGEQKLTLRALNVPEDATLSLQSLRLIKQDAGRIK